jgi:hypothetical protein
MKMKDNRLALSLLIAFCWSLNVEAEVKIKDKIAACINELKARNPNAREVNLGSPGTTPPSLEAFSLADPILPGEGSKIKNRPVAVIVLDSSALVIDFCLAESSGSTVYDEIWKKSLFAAKYKPAVEHGMPFASIYTLLMHIHVEGK